MTKKKQVYRHGEIAFIKTDSIPKEAKLKDTDNLLIGSGGNSHIFKGGKFYEYENGIIFGYLETKNTILLHREHGDKQVGEFKQCKLPDGIYELRSGQEFTPDGLKLIVD